MPDKEEMMLEQEYQALRKEVLKYCEPLALDRIILERFKMVYNLIRAEAQRTQRS